MQKFLGLCLVVLSFAARADSAVSRWSVQSSLDEVYPVLYQALEEHRFFVIFEPNIGANLANFAERWGDDYNRNRLGGIRSMVFCNPWYANQVSNLDPDMLALCPLSLTLIEQQGETRILFVRPAYIAAGSKAEPLLQELEYDLNKAVNAGLKNLSPPQ